MMPIASLNHKIFDTSRFSIHDIEDNRLCTLFLAVKKDDYKQMSLLLWQGGDLNQATFQDALDLAVIEGREKIVQLMLERGVKPNLSQSFEVCKDSWTHRLTVMGHAIENRHSAMVEILLKKGIKIGEVSRGKTIDEGPLDLFFLEHPYRKSNASFLQLLLSKGASIHSLNGHTIFNIAVYASKEELEILFYFSFDFNSIHRKEQNLIGYSKKVNLLDLAVMQAEQANIFCKDPESIAKVELLVKKGANTLSYEDNRGQNYMHWVSHPSLIELFGNSGIDVKKKAYLSKFSDVTIQPIDTAHTNETVNLLCKFGECRENSPFLKNTRAHMEALKRIGFDREKGLNQFDENNNLFLMKAAQASDVAAFVALIGEGINVNQRTTIGTRWTALHHLFSKVYHGSVSPEYNYTSIATDDLEIKLINILIKHNAVPLKDSIGRTPLMCLSFNPFNIAYNNQIIDIYIEFEAKHFNLDPKEYREKFKKLRDGGYSSYESFLGDSVSVPILSVFDSFWASFEKQSEFNPGVSHNPVADWNTMRSLLP